ncbi:sigma-70 family RNA polymerase sigma factor [Bacteroidales bacterium]|nr:sigma-70 family RNA polymerase sigma factor [Bacteroidales bacterium]
MKSKKNKLAAIKLDIHKSLVERSIRGEQKAQFELYKLYSQAMLNIAYRMLGSKEEAEDVLQDSFVDAFRRLHSFRFESTFGAWLKRIVVNHSINVIKKRKLNVELFDSMMSFDDYEDDADELNEEDLEYTVKKVHSAMNKLPEGGRVVMSLYLFEGYDHAEIAEILNISESTSKSQYLRAKRKVKDIILNM